MTSEDPSEFRIYRNKIDRKHVDFLLCDPKTVRQARDQFVEHVFQPANLPLVRIPVRASYSVTELSKQLKPYLKIAEIVQPITTLDSHLWEAANILRGSTRGMTRP